MSLQPLIKRLEEELADQYGWASTAQSRGKLIEVVESKASRLQIAADEYCQIAATSQSEMLALVEEAASGETYFFREPHQFGLLRQLIAPGILEKIPSGDVLRIWSAACSTGEEAYSLAITFDALCTDKTSRRIEILATDVRNRALQVASEGHYSRASLKEVSEDEMQRYFSEAGSDQFSVSPSLRRRVTFRRVNLLDQMFWKRMGGRFDLVVCTNLLSYLHGSAARQMVNRLVRSLRQGGHLMVAPNEFPFVENANLRPCKDAPTFFFRAA